MHRAVHVDGNASAPANTHTLQMTREFVGESIELAIGQLPASGNDRNSVWPSDYLSFKEFVEAGIPGGGARQHCCVRRVHAQDVLTSGDGAKRLLAFS